MHHVDRNSGILNDEEKYSLEERRSYQETFLRELVHHAYAAGTPLKTSLDRAAIKPADIRTLEDLRRIPVTRKKACLKRKRHGRPSEVSSRYRYLIW